MAERKKKPVVPSPQVGSPPPEETETFLPKFFPPPAENLPGDLNGYVKMALEMGAVDARIVNARDIPQDIRSYYALCIFPRCRWLNTSAMCPMIRERVSLEEAVETIRSYQYAVAYKVLPPDREVVAEAASKIGPVNLDMHWTMGGGRAPDKDKLLADIVRLRIIAEMLRKIEQRAFYDGYQLSISIGVGPCLVTWCSENKTCRGMEKGGFCPFVNSRPNGNVAFYIDYNALGRKLGWGEMQVGGNCALLAETSKTEGFYNIGLTFVG